jgi:steroid delta-isomerase-like uncharacterized protein
MTVKRNKEIALRFWEDGLSAGNMAALRELLHPDFTMHAAPPGLPPGPEGFITLIGAFRAAFPDYRDEVDEVIAEGDRVAIRWTFHGRHEGSFQGLPATGVEATMEGVSILRLVDGKVVDDWTTMDMLGLLRQLQSAPVAA